MKVRVLQSRRAINTTAAALLLASLAGVPVLAAPELDLRCDEHSEPNLDVSATALTATPVSSNEELLQQHLLRPRTESAVRGAFVEQEPVQHAADTQDNEVSEKESDEAELKNAADRKVSSYRRKMYRRDI
jgi:hypothetical protein